MQEILYVMVPTLFTYLNQQDFVNGTKAKLTHHD